MKKHGFTLIEVLVVIVVLAIISSAGVGAYSAFRSRNALAVTEELIISHAREAQLRAYAQLRNSNWGIHVSSTAVTIFAGSSFASRDTQQDIQTVFPGNVVVSTTDIVFFLQTGRTVGTTTIPISYEDLHTTISVSSLGVFYR